MRVLLANQNNTARVPGTWYLVVVLPLVVGYLVDSRADNVEIILLIRLNPIDVEHMIDTEVHILHG